MSSQASTSKAGRSSTASKKSSSAKSALVGSKTSAAETLATASLPKRAPFGQEEDEDDDDDGDHGMGGILDVSMQEDGDDDEVMIGDGVTLVSTSNERSSKTASSKDDSNLMSIDPTLKPNFKPLSKGAAQSAQDALDVTRGQLRKIPIPPHRMTPLKNEWPKIYTPLVEMAGLQVRMNVKRKTVEIKVCKICLR
jgi:RNA-binding protein PNO1